MTETVKLMMHGYAVITGDVQSHNCLLSYTTYKRWCML